MWTVQRNPKSENWIFQTQHLTQSIMLALRRPASRPLRFRGGRDMMAVMNSISCFG